LIGTIVRDYPGTDPIKVYELTDRMIAACYFPHVMGGGRPRTKREMFWQVAKAQGLTDGQVARAWERQYGK
jgi:hypothetical protein